MQRKRVIELGQRYEMTDIEWKIHIYIDNEIERLRKMDPKNKKKGK